jgi:hypothetical protein
MAIDLIRRASADTPTVQGKDDSRMMRFAVGNYSGVTRGYLEECDYSSAGFDFTVKSGEIVADGWQAVIDSNGARVTVQSAGGTLYYVVYAEFDLTNAENQNCQIKISLNVGTYPDVTPGDDLTANPTGIRRVPMYRFTTFNYQVQNIERVFKYIEPGWMPNAENATNAERAVNDENGLNISQNYQKKRYLHSIYMWDVGMAEILCQINCLVISDSSTPFSVQSFQQWLYSKIEYGYYPASGAYMIPGNDRGFRVLHAIAAASNGQFYTRDSSILTNKVGGNYITPINITDAVFEL